MRVVSTRHGNGAFFICYAVVRFIFDSVFSVFLIHIYSETTALNHETLNNTVENGVVVKTVFYVR